MTYILVLPALLYAFHRRHWIFRIVRDFSLRREIAPMGTAPRKVRKDLDRLDLPELSVLLECMKAGPGSKPRIYGHKVHACGKWFTLPDSTYSRLVRIPEIVEKLRTPEDFFDCADDVAARIRVLKHKKQRMSGDRNAQSTDG
jgi:hypothetical protein